MRFQAKIAALAVLCWFSLTFAYAESSSRKAAKSDTTAAISRSDQDDSDAGLTDDDRLSLIASALDRRSRLRSERDCSHLVHSIYERAGFPYAYAPSSDIYAGIDGFERVKQPQPGDLVVWRGHVGIVVKPSQHLFFSYLTSGPGIDDYSASYWKKRGHARFYRYDRADCETCGQANLHRLVKVQR
jgi:cell wall-associated NlpC family hydrolase